MLHIENEQVRKLLLTGHFGLEKESLRILKDGSFAHTKDPFEHDEHIVKDFCENQTEINTGIHPTAKEAIQELRLHNHRIYEQLKKQPEREYLWLFSNPPHIHNEADIPIAVFHGQHESKSRYRQYLSDKYGRYKMTFSGIHVNYSFSDELLKADYACSDQKVSFQGYKDRLYLDLARGLAHAGWILTAISAASPLMDASYFEKNVFGRDTFLGMASVRCSELGYWNEFAPVFDYSSIENYAQSIRHYVQRGFLRAPSELYYPIRIKPPGENNLDSLLKHGINHIELRMFDLNPLCYDGVEEKDILFAQLLILWIVSTPCHPFEESDQVHAVQNFKNAAHYDLKTVRMITPYGANTSIADAAIQLIEEMEDFYQTVHINAQEILSFQKDKFVDAQNRYAWKIRKLYGDGFTQKALALAIRRAEEEG